MSLTNLDLENRSMSHLTLSKRFQMFSTSGPLASNVAQQLKNKPRCSKLHTIAFDLIVKVNISAVMPDTHKPSHVHLLLKTNLLIYSLQFEKFIVIRNARTKPFDSTYIDQCQIQNEVLYLVTFSLLASDCRLCS